MVLFLILISARQESFSFEIVTWQQNSQKKEQQQILTNLDRFRFGSTEQNLGNKSGGV